MKTIDQFIHLFYFSGSQTDGRLCIIWISNTLETNILKAEQWFHVGAYSKSCLIL